MPPKRESSPAPNPAPKRARNPQSPSKAPSTVLSESDPGACTSDIEAPACSHYRVLYSVEDSQKSDAVEKDVLVGTYSCRSHANGVARQHLLEGHKKSDYDESWEDSEQEGLVNIDARGMGGSTYKVRVLRVDGSPPPSLADDDSDLYNADDSTMPSVAESDTGRCESDTDEQCQYQVLYTINYNTSWDTTWHHESEFDKLVGTYDCRSRANRVAREYLLKDYDRSDYDEAYEEFDLNGLVRVDACGMEGCMFTARVKRVTK
ncbi:hypothetical protein EDC01DRAFT_667854 [Geopyxis carbonaria]|nr:hypothetical protein EDC01DRAFT_667854 [Geopyxis carbonaria]